MTNVERLNAFRANGHHIRAIVPYRPEGNGTDAVPLSPDIPVVRLDLQNLFLTERPHVDRIHRVTAAIGPLMRCMFQAQCPDVLLVGVPQYAPGSGAVAMEFEIPWVLWEHGVLPAVDGPGFPLDVAPLLFAEAATADRIVACASHVAKRLRAKGLRRIATIPNAIDTQRFAPGPGDPKLAERLGVGASSFVILLVARLDPLKRPRDLIAAASILQARSEDVVFIVVGDGPCRKAMQDECAARALEPCFRFVGGIDYRVLPEYLRLADMVVMPSETEGLARVYLEAQASGRVLLASDIPAAREIVRPQKTGLLFKMGDPVDLAKKVQLVRAQPTLQATIGRNARRFAMERHSLEQNFVAHERVLRDVVRHRSMLGPI